MAFFLTTWYNKYERAGAQLQMQTSPLQLCVQRLTGLKARAWPCMELTRGRAWESNLWVRWFESAVGHALALYDMKTARF